jgi:hypothetical protein
MTNIHVLVKRSRVKVLSMAEERTNIRIEEKIHCHLRYGYFVMVNEIVMTTVEIVVPNVDTVSDLLILDCSSVFSIVK